MKYLFVFGNSPQLSMAELDALCTNLSFSPDFEKVPAGSEYSIVNLNPEDLTVLQKFIGGTTKIAVEISTKPFNLDQLDFEITNWLNQHFKSMGKDKIDFGLSVLSTKNEFRYISKNTTQIKKNLQKAGYKARFVLPKYGENQLSTVVVAKQNLMELIAVFEQNCCRLFTTVWQQDFEDWGKRDYDRPESEGHLGMLPPKVARMMINLALPNHKETPKNLLCDPFCGVGTVAAEALMLGYDVMAADLNPKQVERTRQNLKWIQAEYQITNQKVSIFVSDAAKIYHHIPEPKLDAIVTEPDLGPQIPSHLQHSLNHVSQISEKLFPLYENCLHQWKKVIKPGGAVVIVIPSFNMSKHIETSLVKMTIDKAKIMGYTLIQDPIQYFRPQAVVRRNICIFKLI